MTKGNKSIPKPIHGFHAMPIEISTEAFSQTSWSDSKIHLEKEKNKNKKSISSNSKEYFGEKKKTMEQWHITHFTRIQKCKLW